ncbi:MAG: hypothetical protein IIB74_02470 [Proteobacteria bacterium]|nr:hypothetical protein [Pseudomonadota bacterium]
MKTVTAKINRVNRKLPALIAVGSCMAVLPANALELGELTVQSSLGQPLRASIAFALAPHEQLNRYCVSFRSGPTAGGLPGIGRTTLSVANGVILLTGTTPVREPMLATQVVINCPYTAKFSREYMLFVDPPSETTSASFAAATTAAPVPLTVHAPTAVSRPATVQRRASVNRAPVDSAARYKVKFGDSLSDIVARIENRTLTMWPAVNLIFAANPDAFMDNDPNRLKAGSWLTIPDLGGADPIVVADAPASADVYESAVSSAAAPAAVADTASTEIYEPSTFDVNDADVVEASPVAVDASVSDFSVGDSVPAYEIVNLSASAPVTDSMTAVTTNDLQPGDVILDNSPLANSPAIETAGSTSSEISVGIQPETSASSSGLPAWFLWLAGGGVAFILALLMFGRRLRGLFGSTPVGPVLARPERRSSDYATSGTAEIEVTIIEQADDDGFDQLDDMPTSENLILDADLIDGTGLEEGTDMDVAQDFGFAASADLDIELPFEPVASADVEASVVAGETEILPLANKPTILENEVMPEEDDYDMSVIMDATKMPQPEDATEFDLKAVEVDSGDETMVSNSGYTLSEEVDFKIVEQDYEDELTATQLLNKEIADAALKLSDDDEGEPDSDETSAMPLASVTDLDVTAQLPETGDDDVTSEMPAQTRKGG